MFQKKPMLNSFMDQSGSWAGDDDGVKKNGWLGSWAMRYPCIRKLMSKLWKIAYSLRKSDMVVKLTKKKKF